MYDVIVVGAGCAGAVTALLQARRGRRVLLLDRAAFGRDTLSTLLIHQPGVARLAGWGLLDRLVATGCPGIDRFEYRVRGVCLAGAGTAVHGQSAAYAPRRRVLDALLVEAAVAAGVEYRDRTTVGGLVFDDDRAAGVRARASGGAWTVERGRLVVGADGMRSCVAAAVSAVVLAQHPPKTCVYYTFWDHPGHTLRLYEAPGQWIGALPTNDGGTLVACYFPQTQFAAVRAGAAAAHRAAVRAHAPDLFEEVVSGAPVDRMYGSGDQQNFVRAAAGRGWALVGDSAYHKDSITARGITDAFAQAHLLAGFLTGTDPSDQDGVDRALTAYARAHHVLARDELHTTLAVADLAVTDERLDLLRAVSRDQRMTDLYFALMSGATDFDTFFRDGFFAALQR